MIVERALPFDHQVSCIIIDYHQLSFSLSLFKFFIIVDDSFGNHWPDSGQKTCYRPLSSRKIHTLTSLSYGTPFSIRIFTRKSLELAALLTLLARLPVNYRQLSRTSLAV